MDNRDEVRTSIVATKVVAIIRGMVPEICVRLAKANAGMAQR